MLRKFKKTLEKITGKSWESLWISKTNFAGSIRILWEKPKKLTILKRYS